MNKKFQITSLAIVGASCLGFAAFGQDATTPPTRQTPPSAEAPGQDALANVQQRFHQAVMGEVRMAARKCNVNVEEHNVIVSLLGERELLAGAPASHMGANPTDRAPGSTGAPNPRDQRGEDQRDQDATRDTDAARAGQSNDPTRRDPAADSKHVLGVVVISSSLADGSRPGAGAGARPGDTTVPDRDRDRETGAATTTTGLQTETKSASGVTCCSVRHTKGASNVELVNPEGRVIRSVSLIGKEPMGTRRATDASAPRDRDVEDSTVGREGTDLPGGQRDPAADRRSGDRAMTGGMDAAPEWSVVYTSIVADLCRDSKAKAK